ncbi:MAG: phenylalanine--tRNA ligase subunit beta [Campylobacteraceae bacterium]|nr:phenylalanine--tRNA ligase subunit beta [Campylobacteraceae bacterium]
MIVTRNWLNEWIDISEISSQTILDTLNSIGLEVDSYEEIRMPKKVVVGYVKSKRKHEDSDKLSICEVDVGNEILQIVCGAANVETGQFVPVSLVGSVLPNGLEIKPTKLRGVASNGMICSSTELGLAKTNDGIMVLDESIGKLVIGKELLEYPLLNDDIIEIELTANRGDCLSMHGVARDLSAALNIPLRATSYKEPEAFLGIGRLLSINSNEKINSFYEYRAFEVPRTFKIDLLKTIRVSSAGIKKDNCIESLLNYATYSTGVLFRAYDADKLRSGDSKITFKIKEEKFENSSVYVDDTLLSTTGISRSDKALVDKESKIIIVEANYTDPKIISVASNEDKELKSDEHLYRASRGSEPNLSLGLDYLFGMVDAVEGVNLYSGSQKFEPRREPKTVSFSIEQVNAIIGKNIPRNDVVKILKKLGFDVGVEQELINAKVPFYRHDIENVSDVAEEIVRIIGIDNIPSVPLIFSEKNRINNYFIDYTNKRAIKRKAASSGFYECIHYVFDNSVDLQRLGFENCKVEIVNPITNELNVFRPTLVNHLLRSCERNIKNSQKVVKLFEIGTVFDKNSNESDNLAFLMSGLVGEPSLLNSAKPKEVDFIYFASKVQDIIGKFKCVVPSNLVPYLSKFEQASIVQGTKVIGYIGRLDLTLENELDLPKTYICEIDFNSLKFEEIVAKAYSKFPSISRDLSIIAPKEMRYEEIREVLDSLTIKNLKFYSLVDIYTDESLGDSNSVTIKFTFQDSERTLEDKDIEQEIENILNALKEKLSVGIR